MGIVDISSWLWRILLIAIYVVDIITIPLLSGDFGNRNVLKRIKAHWPFLLVGVVLAIVLDLLLSLL